MVRLSNGIRGKAQYCCDIRTYHIYQVGIYALSTLDKLSSNSSNDLLVHLVYATKGV